MATRGIVGSTVELVIPLRRWSALASGWWRGDVTGRLAAGRGDALAGRRPWLLVLRIFFLVSRSLSSLSSYFYLPRLNSVLISERLISSNSVIS